MKNLIKLILLLSILFSSFPVSANFDSALKLYNKNNFPEAFYAFKNLAYIGDKSSQFNLGVMYFRGEHVEQDTIEAYAWMNVAAENGDESFIRTSEILFKRLTEKEKHAATGHAKRYMQKYGRESLKVALAPKPLSDAECAQDVKLISMKKPKYPRAENQRGQIGFVDVILNVSPQGYPRDISLRSMTAKGFLNPSVKSAMSARWEPKIVSNNKVSNRGVMYRFNFMGYEDAEYKTKKFVKEANKKLSKAESGDVQSQYEYAQTIDVARIMKLDIDELDVEYQTSNQWYLQSAQKGHSLAQYELGKNMLAGKGCEADRETGLKWLRAAALSGHPYAQEEIAMSTIGDGVSDVQRAILWLRKAASSDIYAPKLFLAWELAANPNPEIRDGKEALRLLAEKPKYYFDPVRVYETKAAAYAEAGDYDTAIKWQKKALKKAAKLKWNIAVMEDRLTAYTSSSSWQGVYHVSERR